MTSTVSSHQLIVVGNGFDLECGLNSRFIDFFAPRFKAIDSIIDYTQIEWTEAVEKAGLTAWDFILRRNTDSNWCDIEEVIRRWVVKPKVGTPIIEGVYKASERINKYPFANPVHVRCGNRLADEEKDDAYVYGNVARRIWMIIDPVQAQSFNQRELFPILQSELKMLEDAFDAYLREEVASKYAYQTRCKNLYEKIECDGLPDPSEETVDTSVLSFNYTRPFTDRIVGPGLNEKDVLNIHGRLSNGLIFGVDGSDCMGDEDALPFTKTYRVAIAGTHISRNIFRPAPSGMNSTTRFIKFYGHSLGEPDYSYFQSIFDGVDLYGGNTKLFFYYRPWKKSNGKKASEETARTAMVKRVSKLLTTYGKTLDNTDHGKNLMHKLLLEGRLEIKKI